jgi:hypothetical protein
MKYTIKEQKEKWCGEIHVCAGWILRFQYSNGDFVCSFHRTKNGALIAARKRSRDDVKSRQSISKG